jgi:hypothetical protein
MTLPTYSASGFNKHALVTQYDEHIFNKVLCSVKCIFTYKVCKSSVVVLTTLCLLPWRLDMRCFSPSHMVNWNTKEKYQSSRSHRQVQMKARICNLTYVHISIGFWFCHVQDAIILALRKAATDGQYEFKMEISVYNPLDIFLLTMDCGWKCDDQCIMHLLYDKNKCDLSHHRNHKNEIHTLPLKQLHVVNEE